MVDQHLVVVGASLAGLRAVEAARKQSHTGPITLIGAEQHLPYDRPPLSKQYFDASAPAAAPWFRDDAYLAEELGVEVLLGRPATCLDADRRVVVVGHREVPYDRVVIATGAFARRLPGVDPATPGVHGLRTLDDAAAIRAGMDRGDRVAVVGCGFIGSEVASALHKRGRPVLLVEAAPVPLTRAVGEMVGPHFADLHGDHGVDLRLGTSVHRVERVGDELRLHLSDGSTELTDMVVLGLGAIPATEWLAGSGIELAPDGSVLADASLRTSLPGVYAAGDVVTWHNATFDRLMRLEHWSSAAEQAAVAVKHALGDESATYETVPYFWSDLYERRVQFVGVPATDELYSISDDRSRVALYRQGDQLAGALTIDQPRLTMKLRRLISQRADFSAGIALAHEGFVTMTPV